MKINLTMKENYLIISHKVMEEAAEMMGIENLGKNRLETNEYIGINGTNTCLVRVSQNLDYGAYCVINKSIKRTDGKVIDLTKKLRLFNFHMNDSCTGSGRLRTRTSTNKLVKKLGYTTESSINIESIIHALRSGKRSSKKTGLQVHHEVSSFDHRVEVCWLLPEEKHKEMHRITGKHSRRNGRSVENIGELAWLVNDLESRVIC